jgi:UDP-N-acetylmuramoylalanine--D-glutamate ligase
MIDLRAIEDRAYAVLGLARSGLAAAAALTKAGRRVVCWDDTAARRNEAAAAGLMVADPESRAWGGIEELLLSPGIPHRFPAPHPLVARLLASGALLSSDVELFARALGPRDATIVAITGTNGKSTTTALVGHILSEAGRPVAVGGNIGTGCLALPMLPADGVYVLELSSFQLELLPTARFKVAALVNVTPDHLDRHGDMAGYVAAKRRVFRGQRPGDHAVVAVDDPDCRAIADALSDGPARRITVSADAPPIDMDAAPALPGRHNAQNAAVAAAIVSALGVNAATTAAAIRRFPGLAHRQARVGVVDGILFVNDSKATNADAAATALATYPRVHWIAGGVPKAGGIQPLAPWFDRVARAYLIGEAAQAFAATLGPHVPHEVAGDLATAVVRAHAEALKDGPGAVVLLSPACASYDQFASFEARGDHFTRLVADLARARAA